MVFNTPGDTRDFVKDNYKVRDISQEGRRPNGQGHSTYEFEIPLEQLSKLKKYQMLQKSRIPLRRRNLDAVTSESIKL